MVPNIMMANLNNIRRCKLIYLQSGYCRFTLCGSVTVTNDSQVYVLKLGLLSNVLKWE